ncbi:uncharacterized protein HHUB_3552 [Halobacterium hubeiense]|uniref:Uncharacterized protein n=1 Tax=Halobacterium hubeiense TaxID=1407499 RepID=A0A0U5H3M2_9EURY|nr:uncharacterized protein HHUB_3552 [Halobacterium hubeiense]
MACDSVKRRFDGSPGLDHRAPSRTTDEETLRGGQNYRGQRYRGAESYARAAKQGLSHART